MKLSGIIFGALAIIAVIAMVIIQWPSSPVAPTNTNAAANINVANANSANTNVVATKTYTDYFAETGQPYDEINAVTNSWTNDTYLVRISKGETYCGVNGGHCELVVEHSGVKTVVPDSIFSDTPKLEPFNQGAKLLRFTDANTLLISFSMQDHGGGYSHLDTYDTRTKELTNLIWFVQAESSECSECKFDYAMITRPPVGSIGERKIIFVNNITVDLAPDYAQPGIFALGSSEHIPIATTLKRPYDISFNVTEDYRADGTIALRVNNRSLTYNFDTQELK